jgi:hypothetical protein
MSKSKNKAATAQATVPVVTGDPAVDAAILGVTNARAAVSAELENPLTKTQRLRLVRVRGKGRQLIAPVIGLVNRVPQLAPLGVTPATLNQKLGSYQNLVALLNVVESMALALEDTTEQLQSELWVYTMSIYGIASHSVGIDPDVANIVSQMKAALATGPRIKSTITKTPIAKPAKKGARGSAASSAGTGESPDSGSTTGGNPTGGVPSGSNPGTNGTTQVPVYTPAGQEGTVTVPGKS